MYMYVSCPEKNPGQIHRIIRGKRDHSIEKRIDGRIASRERLNTMLSRKQCNPLICFVVDVRNGVNLCTEEDGGRDDEGLTFVANGGC